MNAIIPDNREIDGANAYNLGSPAHGLVKGGHVAETSSFGCARNTSLMPFADMLDRVLSAGRSGRTSPRTARFDARPLTHCQIEYMVAESCPTFRTFISLAEAEAFRAEYLCRGI